MAFIFIKKNQVIIKFLDLKKKVKSVRVRQNVRKLYENNVDKTVINHIVCELRVSLTKNSHSQV